MAFDNPFERLSERSADYQRMEAALGWLADRWRERPALDDAAEAAGLSASHFQRVFTRWAGVSPKTFVAAIAQGEARRALAAGASVLDTAYDAGLSGPSRLHDLFIAHEAVTPGEARRRGAGVDLSYGYAPTPFGAGLFVLTARGLAGLAFVQAAAGEDAALDDMRRRWPAANWARDDDAARTAALAIFAGQGERPPLVLMGPPFHVQVWKALLTIPEGEIASYGEVAARAGKPGAYRATGAAIGANPISWLVPCHRALARDGRLTGYHWGLARKAAMLGSEAVQSERHAELL